MTYMLNGKMCHEDFCKHRGVIGAGDVQWMTAGRGVLHSEMPGSDELAHGLQLWVNLAAKDKMIKVNFFFYFYLLFILSYQLINKNIHFF